MGIEEREAMKKWARNQPRPRRRRFKGGFRNNGQPRVTLARGQTRVAQLKEAIRELRGIDDAKRRSDTAQAALDGTYVEGNPYQTEICPVCTGKKEMTTSYSGRRRREKCWTCGGVGRRALLKGDSCQAP